MPISWREWARARPPEAAVEAYKAWRATYGLGVDTALFGNNTISQQCLYWCHGWMTARGVEPEVDTENIDA